MRASRANFALIWVQGKGVGAPHYARWTMQSARLWPAFAGICGDVGDLMSALKQRGGFHLLPRRAELEMFDKGRRSVARALGDDAPEHTCSTIGNCAKWFPHRSGCDRLHLFADGRRREFASPLSRIACRHDQTRRCYARIAKCRNLAAKRRISPERLMG
jgi:hypothetical protein